MRAKFVNESSTYSIRFKTDPQKIKEKYPDIFGNLLYYYLENALRRVTPDVFVTGKLDINRFYNFLKSVTPFNKSIIVMKELLFQAAPLLGITDQLKLSREERSEMKFQERAYHGELPIEFFEEAEVPASEAEPDDYVLKSADGETETAFYRFDRNLSDHERNMLRVAYVFKYGDPEKTPWQNYLDARPATKGHLDRHGKSYERTREYGFAGNEYN